MAGSHAQWMRLIAPVAGWLASGAVACMSPGIAAPGGDAPPSKPLAVRVWSAGREIPPGLSAARVLELEAERARSIAGLRVRSPTEAGQLEAWLADEATGDELWCAAARAAAGLERYDLAPFLSPALEPSASARRAVAARKALHALYGRWFARPAELAPYLDSVREGAGTRLLLESSQWEEARSRERLLAELAHRPTSAAAWLADPDPEVRSGAARILAQVFSRADSDTAGTLEVLIAHLEREFEPRAFHEGLQACLAPLERTGAEQPASARLRALLIEIARSEGDPRTLSAAQALARVPWRADGPRDLGHLLTGVSTLGAMLRGLVAADRLRGANDPDPLVGVLSALRQLCTQASAAGLGEDRAVGAVRASLFAVLDDPSQDQAVRAAAAAALGPLARVRDGAQLAAVLGDASVGSQVKHALLGALGAILPDAEPGEEGAQDLLRAVAAQTGAGDSDLRRRALALFADARIAPLLEGLDPSFLVARLEEEDGREATLELLSLVRRFGRADMLDGLLALERFERLCGEPETLTALAEALAHLVGRSGPEAMRAALRLAAVRPEETSLARLRHALVLVAALDDAAAFALAPDEHRSIAHWGWRVVHAGVAPRDLAPSGLAFVQRLLDVHLPRGEAGDVDAGIGLGPFERAHLAALLRADSFLGGSDTGGGTKSRVEDAFERAHDLAAEEGRLLVLRDRARFRAAANECVKAVSDYRRLVEAGKPGDELLGIPDLRCAVELLARLDQAGKPGPSATAGEACELLRRIILRQAWRAEPASVRMQDLRDWGRRALESKDLSHMREVHATLADLPLTQLETQLERVPPPTWFGLTREPAWFQELLDLRARMSLGLRELEARG